MKRFLLFLSAAVCSLSMMAQSHEPVPANFKNHKVTEIVDLTKVAEASAMHKAPAKTLGENQHYIGGYDTDTYGTYKYGMGSYFTGTVKYGVYIYSEYLEAYNGGNITGMRVALGSLTGQTSSTLYIYGVTSSNITQLASATVSELQEGWNEVTFDTPVTINTSSYYGYILAYSCNQTSTNTPVGLVKGTGFPIYIYGTYSGSTGWYSSGLEYGDGYTAQYALCAQAIVEKELTENTLSAYDFEAIYDKPGATVKPQFYISNGGGNAITSAKYTVSINGEVGEEQDAQLSSSLPAPTGYSQIESYSVPVTIPDAAGVHVYNVEIKFTKVNGVDNTSADPIAKGTVTAFTQTYSKKVCVEEYTGTGCGYCPRGMAGMEYLRESFGEKFVGIAVHRYNSADPMYCSTYTSIDNWISGAPSALIDRGTAIDPYFGSSSSTTHGIKNDFQEALESTAYAGVTVDAQFTDDTHAKVQATATVEAPVDMSMDLEFVVICDSLYNSAWKQINYYYQYSASSLPSDLQQYGSGGTYGQYKFCPYFNDVALVRSYTSAGKTQISTLSLKADTPQEVSYTLTLPTTAALKTAYSNYPAKMAIVALLVDPSTGSVINCDKKYFYAPEPAGIETINADANVNVNHNVYNLAGQKVNQDAKGIVIINGKKVVR